MNSSHRFTLFFSLNSARKKKRISWQQRMILLLLFPHTWWSFFPPPSENEANRVRRKSHDLRVVVLEEPYTGACKSFHGKLGGGGNLKSGTRKSLLS